jgi:polyribonucleotide nucleotidyltransferase
MVPALFSGAGKRAVRTLEDEWIRAASEHAPDVPKQVVRELFTQAVRDTLRRETVLGRRADGRALTALRPLYAQAGNISPILHGSGIFYRGGTHVLSVLTLGAPDESLAVDTIEEHNGKRRFMHHYNFPPFSAGETGKVGNPNRRMVGHGALVEKALAAVLPPEDTFPYSMRVVSECFASNGSTSMASVCASTIALMDGGVPITAPVVGIAMGLMTHDGKHAILTDIQGPEDEHGDMDFKVAGTETGITALQLDVKVDGVPLSILVDALRGARHAHKSILDVITSTIAGPRGDISPNAPEIITLAIAPNKIGTLIGPGGKTLRRIRDRAGAQDIQVEEDGTVYAIGVRGSAERAAQAVSDLTREYRVGEQLEGAVSRIVPFGAFVRINESTEGLVHISDIAPFRIARVEDALAVGERVPVIVKEVDGKGRLALSIAAADADFVRRKGITSRA